MEVNIVGSTNQVKENGCEKAACIQDSGGR